MISEEARDAPGEVACDHELIGPSAVVVNVTAVLDPQGPVTPSSDVRDAKCRVRELIAEIGFDFAPAIALEVCDELTVRSLIQLGPDRPPCFQQMRHRSA